MKTKILAALALLACAPAFAQVVCGPYSPFARSINPDGTETVTANVQCQNPDPANWDHTYTIIFPSILTYYSGTTLQFVGNASAEVIGHHDCVGSGRAGRCGVRLVTVDNATLMDPSGNSLPLVKVELGTLRYPVDAWQSTTPLAADTQYSFEASGTANSGMTDTLHIEATYHLCVAGDPAPCPPPPPSCPPEGCGDQVEH